MTIEETGLWKNPKYLKLGCSPDGLIKSPLSTEIILLEIKVWMKAHIDPSVFDQYLTDKEKATFYLFRNSMGYIELKNNHSYYYQIQMNLDILELEWCHLLVCSESGHVVVPVRRNLAFWTEKRIRAIAKHRELIIPEKVTKRTLRWLAPLEIMYTEFHENAEDHFFL